MGVKPTYVRLTRAARSVAKHTGLLQSLERSSRPSLRHIRSLFAVYDAQDLASLDLPWWSYRAIEVVEEFLSRRSDARVFEFGSGASTLWLAKRAREVHTVEHDLGFVEVVRGILERVDNVVMYPVEAPVTPVGVPGVWSQRAGSEDLDFSTYVDTIARVGGEFDLIVVDGRARVECLRRAIPHLASDGLVVFDDVERARYRSVLTLPGFTVDVLRGATPCVPYPTSTAILQPSARD